MARHVRAGGSVCLLGDHRDSAGVDVPFFGIDARSTMLPAMLAVRYHARLIAARVDRTGGTRFSVHLERVPVHPTGSEDADIHTATSDLQAVFQRWIEMRPAEWLWFYNRWGIGK